MDELDKSQKIAPITFEGILTPEELDREIRRIWKICILTSLLVPALAGIVVALLLQGLPAFIASRPPGRCLYGRRCSGADYVKAHGGPGFAGACPEPPAAATASV